MMEAVSPQKSRLEPHPNKKRGGRYWPDARFSTDEIRSAGFEGGLVDQFRLFRLVIETDRLHHGLLKQVNGQGLFASKAYRHSKQLAMYQGVLKNVKRPLLFVCA